MDFLGNLLRSELDNHQSQTSLEKIIHSTRLFMDASKLLVADVIDGGDTTYLGIMWMYCFGVVDYLSQCEGLNEEEFYNVFAEYYLSLGFEQSHVQEILSIVGDLSQEEVGVHCMKVGGSAIKAWVHEDNKNAPLALAHLMDKLMNDDESKD